IDQAVHNAARISKLPGSWARKGPDLPRRPHRPCLLLSVPDPVEVLPRAKLEELVAEARREADSPPAGQAGDNGEARRPWFSRIRVVNDDGRDAYGRKALDDECGRVAMAPVKERNKQLNRSAFVLGQLVGGEVLARALVEEKLTFAA